MCVCVYMYINAKLKPGYFALPNPNLSPKSVPSPGDKEYAPLSSQHFGIFSNEVQSPYPAAGRGMQHEIEVGERNH